MKQSDKDFTPPKQTPLDIQQMSEIVAARIKEAASHLPQPPSTKSVKTSSKTTETTEEESYWADKADNESAESQVRRFQLAKLTEEVNQLKHANESLGLKNRSDENDINLREHFAVRTFWFVLAWSAALIILLVISGAVNAGVIFNSQDTPATSFLSDRVLITLIGAVTVNVMAVFIAVVAYLFPKKK